MSSEYIISDSYFTFLIEVNECKNEQRMGEKEVAGCLTLSNPVMTETEKCLPPR